VDTEEADVAEDTDGAVTDGAVMHGAVTLGASADTSVTSEVTSMQDPGAGGGHITGIIGVDGILARLERVGILDILITLEIGFRATGGFATNGRVTKLGLAVYPNYFLHPRAGMAIKKLDLPGAASTYYSTIVSYS